MRYVLPFLFSFLVAGCFAADVTRLASAPESRADVPPSKVKVYSDTASIACSFTRVALITAHTGELANREYILKKTRPKAAEQGANAIVLQGRKINDVTRDKSTDVLAVYQECR